MKKLKNRKEKIMFSWIRNEDLHNFVVAFTFMNLFLLIPYIFLKIFKKSKDVCWTIMYFSTMTDFGFAAVLIGYIIYYNLDKYIKFIL